MISLLEDAICICDLWKGIDWLLINLMLYLYERAHNIKQLSFKGTKKKKRGNKKATNNGAAKVLETFHPIISGRKPTTEWFFVKYCFLFSTVLPQKSFIPQEANPEFNTFPPNDKTAFLFTYLIFQWLKKLLWVHHHKNRKCSKSISPKNQFILKRIKVEHVMVKLPTSVP